MTCISGNSTNFSENAYLNELSFIQNCIDNMRENSRTMKMYAILIALAELFSGMIFRPFITGIVAVGLIVLLILDCYYLRLERAYRKMYDDVRVKRLSDQSYCILNSFNLNPSIYRSVYTENQFETDLFDLNPAKYLEKTDPIHKIALSITELPFYGTWIVFLIIFIIGAWF